MTTSERPKLPPGFLERIQQIGRDAVLAGLSAEETIDVVNTEARKHGFEYRPREQHK